MEVGTQKILAGCRSLINTSKKTNQADTDQFTQAAQGRCPAAEVEQTAPSIQIDLVYIL